MSNTEKFSEELKDSWKDKNKLKFFAYEFFGSALIAYFFNITKSLSSMLYIATLVSWEVSAAHFNNALSIGTLFFNHTDFKENIIPYLILTIVQFLGSLAGLLCTYLTVYYSSYDQYHKTIYPTTEQRCPTNYGALPSQTGCKERKANFNIFLLEFVCSFLYIFIWLIIRNYDVKGDLQKWQTLIKPYFIVVAYLMCNGLSENKTGGFLNPTLAIEQTFWEMASFNYYAFNDPNNTIS